MEGVVYDGVKVFSATRSTDREKLGAWMTEWLKNNANLEVVETRVVQSSDNAYHCLSIVAFWKRRAR